MSRQPNILFIFSDQQHWRAMGCEDAFFNTPNLDRLAREGVRFSNAFCTTPQCSPSRSSMLTGLYPSKTGVLGNVGTAGGEPLRMPTLAPLLQQAGYHTAYFGKWHLGKKTVATAGWDQDFGVTGDETTNDAKVTQHALRFLCEASADDQTPFALFLSYNNPHDIYDFHRHLARDKLSQMDLPHSWEAEDLQSKPPVQLQFMEEDQGATIHGRDEDIWKLYRDCYREKTRLYDEELSKVFNVMDQFNFHDNTLVVVTSDHGDMDSHHRLIFKGPFMYEQMMRVPLLVRLPVALHAGRHGRTCDVQTVNTDLVPTLLDFAGHAPIACDGRTLRPFLTHEDEPWKRDHVIGQYYGKQRWVNPIRVIRTPLYKYVRYILHGEELYDLTRDPHELHNLVDDLDHDDVRRDLGFKLDAWIRRNNDPFYSQVPTDRFGHVL